MAVASVRVTIFREIKTGTKGIFVGIEENICAVVLVVAA